MAIKKDAPKQALQRDDAVDAAFGRESDPVFGAMNRIRSARTNNPGKAKKRAADAARTKITFDWSQDLIEQVMTYARKEGVPANQLAAVLIKAGFRDLAEGSIDLDGMKIPSRSPKFQYFLKMDEEGEK